ncbi:tetratricopeptide repeat protein [Leptolyngbya sp. PCC 6406]|uniref:tetratricopeptide repeat protein n=1 Tax=Leptolyngbya sp. PCC 6406 TaxID=1173264 RepID=UPI00138AE93F|nr:tetratricopeptide repeat protein [Leptolyngbya sp. PCC 6406]
MNIRRWPRFRESALMLTAGAGTVASLASQNAALVSIPVTALVAMGLIDRRRLEQQINGVKHRSLNLEGRMNKDLNQLQAQVSALPSPETLTGLQRAAMAHSDRAVVRFSQALERTQQDVERRIQGIERPNLSHLYQDMAELQDQYTYACSTLSNLDKQVQRLSSLPRVEATEADVSHLKTELMQVRVSLETLNSESKAAQSTLQDAVRHLDRRLRQAAPGSDPHLLKGEVRELIKAVADLVPRREFNALTEKLRTVESIQDTLRRHMDSMKTAGSAALNGSRPESSPQLRDLTTEVDRLAGLLRQVEERIDGIAVPFDITAEIRGTTATYLSGMQWQLATLEQATQDLMQYHKSLPAPGEQGFLQRFSTPAPSSSEAAAPTQWLMAFQSPDATESWSSTVDQALFAALDQVQQRLVLVWPWSPSARLDPELITRFKEVLERRCRLEVGWCHSGDRRDGLLLRSIDQQWPVASTQRQMLKTALRQLLPLKQTYPDHFTFKILGTDEQFLVCDRAYAIVGLRELPAASSVFPSLDLRLRTTDVTVVERLLRRFDDPNLCPEDAVAYFNRAVTRYDLRDPDGAIADYSQVLQITPEDALALNNRGVVWGDRKQPKQALADFDRALALHSDQFAARCNRGYLHLSLGNYTQALEDLEVAATLAPTSSLVHFYNGQARQKLGDRPGAIAAYSAAIQHQGQAALPYCYRGSVYQQQGDTQRAIADLETAASLLHAQRDHRTLGQITQALGILKQTPITQPLRIRTP